MSARIEIIVAAVDKVTNEMNRMAGATVGYAQKTQTAMEKLNRTLTGLRNLAVGGMIAYPIISFLKSSVQAAMEAEEAEAKLTAAIGHRSQALIDNAKILQKKSIYDDEDLMNAEALLGMFIKEESAIKKLMPSVMNLAAAKGIDLASAAELVRKGMTGSTTALSRYGIQLEGAAGTTKRMDSVVRELNAAFGGQSDALAETTSGKIKKYQNQMEELKESLGAKLLPVLVKITEKILEAVEGWDLLLGEDEEKDIQARTDELITLNNALKAISQQREEIANKPFPHLADLGDVIKAGQFDFGFIKDENGYMVKDIRTYDQIVARRDEILKQSKEMAKLKREENTVTLKVDTKDEKTKAAKEEYGTSPFSMTKTAAAMSRSLALKQQLVLDSKFLREAGVTEIEITQSTEKIKTLLEKQGAEERAKIADQEMRNRVQMAVYVNNALTNLAMSALANNKQNARKNRNILIAMAITEAAGAAVAGVYAAIRDGKTI